MVGANNDAHGLIAIGHLRTTHGVKGFFKVKSFSGEISHFQKLEQVIIKKDQQSRKVTVEEIKGSGKSLLVKFKEINTPEEGRLYRSWDIWVDREFANPLEDSSEFYSADLCKCDLVLNGEVIGTVTSIYETGLNDLLEVKCKDGQKRLVPFRAEFIGSVDIEAGTIELLVDWILD